MALLQGKTAVITGGSAGVGLATAKRFAAAGVYVFVSPDATEVAHAALSLAAGRQEETLR